MKHYWLSLVLTFIIPIALATRLTAANLEDFESVVGTSQEVMPALADLEEALANRDAHTANSGLRIFAGAGYAINNEPNNVGSTDRTFYDRHYGRVGLSLPLAGSWARQKGALIQAEARVLTAQQALEAQKRSSLAALRKAYIVRWGEIQRRSCLSAYLKRAQDAEDILQKRMREGLLLPADYQTFRAAFAQARQLLNISQALEVKARGVMSLATGQDTESNAIIAPDLPRLIKDEARLEAFVREHHPEVIALQEAAVSLNNLSDIAAISELGASFDVAYAPTRDIPGTTGDNFSFGVNFEVPLGIMQASEAASARAQAMERKARHVALLRRNQLLNDLHAALASNRAAQTTLDYSAQRLDAASKATRASRLRLATVAGDTFEQHIRARHQHLAASLDAIDAIAQLMQSQAEVLRIATDAGGGIASQRESISQFSGVADLLRQITPESLEISMPASNLTGDSAQKKAAPVTSKLNKCESPVGKALSVYLWDAESLLHPSRRTATFAELRASRIGHVLLSLNAQQMHAIRAKKGASLRTIIQMAHEQGIKISLLLGDPEWILPKGRSSIVAIIRDLSSVPFDGLHLDLEPDQLPNAAKNQAKLAKNLADTVQEVTASSPWPVSLSVHPRYLSPQGPSPWFSKRLVSAGVRNVTVMLYTANTEKVVNTMRDLATKNPRISFMLAVSVEINESTSISLYAKGHDAIQDWISNIKAKLGLHIHGVVIQSWEDYRKVRKPKTSS